MWMKRIKKNKKLLPIVAECRNCGTGLAGPYCSRCGQEIGAGIKRTVGNLVFNVVENMFVLDNKLFSTLKYLLFYPGKLTNEYINGRLVSYMHPSKLFWFIMFISFTIITFHVNRSEKDRKEKEKSEEVIVKPPVHPTNLAASKENTNSFERTIERAAERIDRKELIGNIAALAPYAVFLLIPFFALLLYIFFRKGRPFYVDHFAFALHYHSFVFLLFTAYTLLKKLFPVLDNYDTTVILIFPLIYFLIAAWVVYRPRLGSLLCKTFLIGFVYGITTFSFILSFIIIVAIVSSKL